jgi:hypothetical protein
MTEALTVRFHETQTYDIFEDADIVTLMATTGTGTYHCRAELGRASKLREDRKQFKEYVIKCMQDGVPPHEAQFD